MGQHKGHIPQYSNHIHALSNACNSMGLKSIGVIRGSEQQNINSTLSFCVDQNMLLHYMNRSDYRHYKYSKKIMKELKSLFGNFYTLPEGGNNILGLQGCAEIIKEIDFEFDILCCAVGTGCTASGLIRSLQNHHHVIGFCPFKKVYEQKNNIIQFCNSKLYSNWELISDTDFGGFGKVNGNLIKFIREFKLDYNIELDLIYMGKLFYYLFNLIRHDFFSKKTRILVLNSGGLQGLKGFNFKY